MRSLLTFLALMVFVSVAVAEQSLPLEVRAGIEEACGGKATMKDGFITKKDVNGDGRDDYILNFAKLGCSDLDGSYCGTAGCLTMVFVSLPDAKIKRVLNSYAQDVEFEIKSGKPTMTVFTDGTTCGKREDESCEIKYRWNGNDFAKTADSD